MMSHAEPLDRETLHATVGPLMILHQDYAPAQYWLGFVAAVIRLTRPQPASASSPQALRRLSKRTYVTLDRRDLDSMPYTHQRDVAQYELPFVEGRMVSDQEWRALAKANFPAWDRLEGRLPVLSVAGHDHTEVSEWMSDNCRGRYRYCHGLWRNVTFARLSDYAMAKIRFS